MLRIFGERAMIGTGSVVSRSIPLYMVAVGVPAKVIKKLDKDKGSWNGA